MTTIEEMKKEKSIFFSLTDRKLNFAIYRVESFSYPHLRNKLKLNWILSSDTLNQSTVFTQSSLFSVSLFFGLTWQTFSFLFTICRSIDIMTEFSCFVRWWRKIGKSEIEKLKSDGKWTKRLFPLTCHLLCQIQFSFL